MKISDASSVSNKSSKAKKAGKTSGAGFASFLESGDDTKISSSQPVAPISAVNIVNEVEEADPEQRKKQAIERGNELLDELESLRDGLLLGTLTPQDIQKAYSMSQQKREKLDDPELEFLINEIEVRSAVELAKLGQI